MRKNVIVVYIESLSSYKSKFFKGLENNTPYIDTLASNNIALQEFYTTGYNSFLSRYSLVTGLHPINANYDIVSNKQNYIDSIPAKFSNSGYKTILFHGGDSTYDKTNNIMKNAGIKEIYDSTYNNIYREDDIKYVFKSVNDNILYKSILNWYNKNKKQPFFIIAATVTTHNPYLHPETYEYSYDKTLSYADNAINNFVYELKKTDFFENGILVITSDHRVMLPISNKEYDVLGPLASARIPLIIIDGKNNYKINGQFSTTDLGKSLEYINLDRVCFNQFQRNIFTNTNNNQRCIIYQQLTNPSLVDIKCGKWFGNIILDGDNTRFIDEGNLQITNDEKEDIINYINYLRIKK